jgi:hypothetical protein
LYSISYCSKRKKIKATKEETEAENVRLLEENKEVKEENQELKEENKALKVSFLFIRFRPKLSLLRIEIP